MLRARAVAAAALALALSFRGHAGAQTPTPPPAHPDSGVHDSLPAVLIGHVVDSIGFAIPGAEITMLKSDRVHAITGDSGEFRIAGLPPGTVVFNVRRIGFEAATFTAVLKSGKTHRTNFRLSANAVALPTVNVADTAVQSHWLDAFNSRKSAARGTFITRADIVKKGARNAVDIVRTVPGIRLDPMRGGGGYRVVMTRGSGARACIPTMYLHGMPYSGTLDDFSADDIEGLELYLGVSEIPPEFDKNGRGICGVIVVWTRDPRKPP
jgi:hypothetical protein